MRDLESDSKGARELIPRKTVHSSKGDRRENFRVLIEVVGMMAIVLSLYLTRETLKVNRDMATAAARPVITLKNLKVDSFHFYHDDDPKKSNTLLCNLEFQNVSQSPAMNIEVKLETASSQRAAMPQGEVVKGEFNTGFIGQGATEKISGAIPVPTTELARLVENEGKMATWDVEVTFSDMYGNRYVTEYFVQAWNKEISIKPTKQSILPSE